MPYADKVKKQVNRRRYDATDAGRLSTASRQRRWRLKKGPEWLREYKAKYGNGPKRARLLAEQCGKCASCGSSDPGHSYGWALDHDHNTGEVRAVLCHGCNSALGLLKEDAVRVESLARYIRQFKEKQCQKA